MEQEIIKVILGQLGELEGIRIDTDNQDTERVGHKIEIAFGDTNTSLICRWHKQGNRFDCWYQKLKNGTQQTDTLYRVDSIETAKVFCEMVKLGLRIGDQYSGSTSWEANVLEKEELEEIAGLTTNQAIDKLYRMDVRPLSLYSETVSIMNRLVDCGYSGRELDTVGVHHDYLGDLTGKSTTESHRTHLQRIIDSKGRNHSYLTARGRVRGDEIGKDYATALKLQLILKLSQNEVCRNH